MKPKFALVVRRLWSRTRPIAVLGPGGSEVSVDNLEAARKWAKENKRAGIRILFR